MNFKRIYFKKAALLNAAFLFFSTGAWAQKPVGTLENLKNKTGELLMQKQKPKAQQLILSFLKAERSKAYRAEASELLFDLGQSFLTREAQQEYETSLIETLSNEKKSLKAAESCLQLEPENVDCLIQKARLLHRARNEKEFVNVMNNLKELFLNSYYESYFKQFTKTPLTTKQNAHLNISLVSAPQERSLFLIIFEIDRAFKAKNYARAREVLVYAEKHYNDWPDIAYYKNKLNAESVENTARTADDLMTLYLNKCKNLSRSILRKYRYDFDLCLRS